MNSMDEGRARSALANAYMKAGLDMPASTAQVALEALARAGFKLVRTEVLEALRDRAKACPDG